MTTVLAVAGSARRGGNTDMLLEGALDVMRGRGAAVETIVPRRLDITPCRSCGGCDATGVCVIKDVMQDLYVRFSEADHVVVAAPVYFTSVPGHVKVLIDRFQCFWVRTFRLGEPPQPRRRGMFLCAGGMASERFFTCSRSVVGSWMASLNMRCAVSRFFPGVDAEDGVRRRPEYLDEVRAAAEELLAGGA